MDPQSMDPMSKSMPTHPAAKGEGGAGCVVDQYAQIALFDAEGVVHKLETRLS